MRVSLFAVVLLLVPVGSACCASGAETIPSDFALSVGFASENIAAQPGDVVSWRTRIDSRGQAVQELYYLEPKKSV